MTENNESGTHQEANLLSDEEKHNAVKAAHNNDLRLLLGVLFVIYGVIVGLVGIIDPSAGLDKTGGIAINLWSGIAMLIVGIIFLLWNFLRPIPDEDIIASAEASAAQAQIVHQGTAAQSAHQSNTN